MKTSAIILAAGQGTRMKSSLPKVLHPLAGRPLVQYSLDAVKDLCTELPVLVVGHGAEPVKKVVGAAASFALQEKQLGTGHAVMAAESYLKDKAEIILVIYADMPLLQPETLTAMLEAQKQNSGPITMLTMISPESHGFGRVIRKPDGSVQEVVEELHTTPEQRAITELNVGAYCFQADWLWPALKRIPVSPKGEYYLTDAVGLAAAAGLRVQAITLKDNDEAIGINNRVHLAEAEAILRRRINTNWMMAGVSIIDPMATYIEPGVQIGEDTTIWPGCYLRGTTTIGRGCEIGPGTILENTQVGDDCTILLSVLEGAKLENHVSMGPYGHLRKGTHLANGVHMGNFGEVKDSYLGPGTKMGHFSYIGNAQIGANVNIGAGTITCNFDGSKKHPTEIGDNVFVGSDTMLVAPIKLGNNARTGAGSVVTHDVPDDITVVGVPARPFTQKDKGE